MEEQKTALTKQTLDTTDETARLYQSEVGGDEGGGGDLDFIYSEA